MSPRQMGFQARFTACASSGERSTRTVCSRRQMLQRAAAILAVAAQPVKLAAGKRSKADEVADAVRVEWPAEFPFELSDFRRYDETSDALFYQLPKLGYHIDDGAVLSLERFNAQFIREKFRGTRPPDVLDLCSSWVSYLPSDYRGDPSVARVAGVGMNAEELQRNPQLTDFIVRDLNKDPSLPYGDGSFDLACCALSIDYLTRPLEVMREVRRVLRPGGACILSFSNRLFSTKAVAHWTSTGDVDHVYAAGSYLHYAGFADLVAEDRSPRAKGADPLYVVWGRRP